MLVLLLLSLKSTVSLPVVHCSFTGAVSLISGCGLNFARTSHADHIISWPPHIQYASAAYGICSPICSCHTLIKLNSPLRRHPSPISAFNDTHKASNILAPSSGMGDIGGVAKRKYDQ